MKKSVVALLCSQLIFLPILANRQIPPSYKLVGEIKGLVDGEKVVMTLSQMSKGLPFDSAFVKKGQFVLEGHLSEGPRLIFLSFDKHANHFISLLLNNEKVTILCDTLTKLPPGNILDFLTIKESPTSSGFQSIIPLTRLTIRSALGIIYYINKQKDKEDNGKIIEGLLLARSALYKSLGIALHDMLNSDPHNQVIPQFVIDLYTWIGKESFLKDIYEKLDLNAKNSFYGKLLAQNIKSVIGAEAPDCQVLNETGKTISIKELISGKKLTLLYFWSSSPDYKYNRKAFLFELLSHYNKYQSKGLNIIGVGVDTNAVRHNKILRQDRLPWSQVSDFKGETEGIAKAYSFNRDIWPFNILIDETGNIIAWQVEGPILQWYLSKLDNTEP